MPRAALITPAAPRSSTMTLARALEWELGRQGVPCELHHGVWPAARDDVVDVWLDPPGFLDGCGIPEVPDRVTLARTAVVYEQGRHPLPEDPGWDVARHAGVVFTAGSDAARVLERHRLSPRVLRLGHSEALDPGQIDHGRPVDVAVLGSDSPRRTELMRRAAQILAVYRVESAADPGPEQDTTTALAHAKVVLNVHDHDEDLELEWQRVLEAIHAGAVVVSEHSASMAPLRPGEDLLVGSAAALPHLARSLLRDPAELTRMRAAAYERIRSWMPFALPVSILRASLVELVGLPPVTRTDAA